MKTISTVFAAPGDASAVSSQPAPLPVVRYRWIRGCCCVYGRTRVFFETAKTRRQNTIIEPESSRFSTRRRRAILNGRPSVIDIADTPPGSAVLKTIFRTGQSVRRFPIPFSYGENAPPNLLRRFPPCRIEPKPPNATRSRRLAFGKNAFSELRFGYNRQPGTDFRLYPITIETARTDLRHFTDFKSEMSMPVCLSISPVCIRNVDLFRWPDLSLPTKRYPATR